MSDSAGGTRRSTCGNISEIRTFFRTNETPILFVGPTAFNLLGLDRWVRNFSYIAYYDSWEVRIHACSSLRSKHARRVQSSRGDQQLSAAYDRRYGISLPARGRFAQGRDGVLRRGDGADLLPIWATT